MPTLREISRLTGLSISTMSRVLNGSINVSEKTRTKVLKALKKYNYTQSDTIKKGLKKAIGVLVPDLQGDHYSLIAEGIESILIKNNYEMLLTTMNQIISREAQAFKEMSTRRVDGIILCTSSDDDNLIKRYIDKILPIVTVDRGKSDIKIDTVGIDNYNSAKEAAKYLYKKGHRKILFIEGPEEIYSCILRKKAFEDFFIRKNNVEIHFKKSNFGIQNGYNSVKNFIKENGINFTAIFFIDDWTALGGLKVLKELNIKCPKEVSIMGFDDSEFSPYLDPALTTVKQPTKEIGIQAAQLLLERVEGKSTSKVKRKIFLPTEIIERDSVIDISKK
ncbi:LacI family transcriptional regulator [Tepiditoga spiralis]|uniref:LacI family transcriptional regulator n=1 Tax=Tepiditoga spiralis TaxID=2108365 RepID=A0A7G1G9M9_9BACT|nr:LacI family DNA-binding transcriptional regulator [Tepiditoga spiralis]BBE31667.1 LacI family transcriptional regulator [Tepiditoga spiralis]